MDNSPKKYSQNDEQFVIEKLFKSNSTGRLLDIGAYAPDVFSNSRALLDAGWEGVLVEPSPGPFGALMAYYGGNPKVQLVHAALGLECTFSPFFDSGGDAVSTSVPAHVTRWTSANVKFTRFWSVFITWKVLFDSFGTNFDFINLDVESQNRELFEALIPLMPKQTKAVCVEHDGHADWMVAHAAGLGFEIVMQNAENIILKR